LIVAGLDRGWRGDGGRRIRLYNDGKVENHAHAVALHFMYYNFVRIHQTLKVTPAMAAGVTDRLWEVADIVDVLDAWEAKQKREGVADLRSGQTGNRGWLVRPRDTAERRAGANLRQLRNRRRCAALRWIKTESAPWLHQRRARVVG
jgi:hypothetical protein